MERTLLVSIKLESKKESWSLEDIARELKELVISCGAEIVDNIYCRLNKPTANLFIGQGKAKEIALRCGQENIDTVIFSCDISGTQQRNLEEIIGKKTIDRTQLILDIFAKHALSPEGKAQVELAQLEYLLPRLVGKGIMLSRLGGGIGTRGPGEKKLEVDRRKIKRRIDKLRQYLKDLTRHRRIMRKKRKEENISTVALVGYTNAGKSTLLNSLTGANQLVDDALFTTLDPLAKSLKLSNGQKIVLLDTVGFLYDLPHTLIEAFKATLEEVKEADLIVHVLDVSSPLVYEHQQVVSSVLKELAVEETPLITALNKIDLLLDKDILERYKKDFPCSIAISAKTGENLELLLKEIENKISSNLTFFKLKLPLNRMDLVDLFYREGKVKKILFSEKEIKIEANLPTSLVSKLLKTKELEQN
ncbi:MAG: GTPase HflX [Candidatus Omnitrophica bacterium]|nr:GTPase HflX [Candidatus Omnitrophota bacterium]